LNTIRETVINALKTTLENYGDYDALRNMTVLVGRVKWHTEDYPLPVVSILPGLEENVDHNSYTQHNMPIEFVLTLGFDVDSAYPEAEIAMGELIKALGTYPQMERGGVRFSYAGVNWPDLMNQRSLIAIVGVEVEYWTDAGDPYTLTDF
jgi:hypothetical protein